MRSCGIGLGQADQHLNGLGGIRLDTIRQALIEKAKDLAGELTLQLVAFVELEAIPIAAKGTELGARTHLGMYMNRLAQARRCERQRCRLAKGQRRTGVATKTCAGTLDGDVQKLG